MRTILLLLLTPVFTSPAFGEELRLYAAAGVKAPLVKLAAEYEATAGHKVICVFDTAGATEQRFRADPEATFLITTQVLISEGEKTGKLRDGITYRLGDTVAGFAAPPGSPKPDISTPQKLKAALLSAHRIALSDPAGGARVRDYRVRGNRSSAWIRREDAAHPRCEREGNGDMTRKTSPRA